MVKEKLAESREERVTGKPPIEDSGNKETIPKDSREYHATKGWPNKKK